MGEKRRDDGSGLFNEICISKWANAGFPGMDEGIDGANHPEDVARNIRIWAREGRIPLGQYKFAKNVVTVYCTWMDKNGFERGEPPQALVVKLNLKIPKVPA